VPAAFDAESLDAVVSALLDRLEGDWLLIGGALVALWLEPRRVTEDIDLIGLSGSQDERLALMQAASDLGLPVETVNSAADFFVRRLPGWEHHIEPFRSAPRARLFRPTPTLFLQLKLGRLSEQDLADCLSLIDHARRNGLAVDTERVIAALSAQPAADEPLAGRRLRLRAALEA
jgi:hypothetical protein